MGASQEDIPQVEIIAVGSEIVSGVTTDTNSTFLCNLLRGVGRTVSRITSVGDVPETMTAVLDEALQRVDVVILTGGLGSTHDDITKHVLAGYFGSRLVPDDRVREMVVQFFEARARVAPETAFNQAQVPDNATILYNEKGTAPGLLFHQKNQRVYALPGVPLEAEYLARKYILPDLQSLSTSTLEQRILLTTGIAESALWEKFGRLGEAEKLVRVASLPSHLGVRIHLSAQGRDEADAKSKLDEAESLFRGKLSHYIYGTDGDTLESRIGEMLKQDGATLAVAESCTGGLIGHRLTNVSGSSQYFLEGRVTYSNEAKMQALQVDPGLIQDHGAVSEPVAEAMAQGIREVGKTTYGLAVTGIAGPDGGTEAKPVGLTFIAVADRKGTHCERFVFPQDRVRNKERAAQAALNLLRLRLMGLIV